MEIPVRRMSIQALATIKVYHMTGSRQVPRSQTRSLQNGILNIWTSTRDGIILDDACRSATQFPAQLQAVPALGIS